MSCSLASRTQHSAPSEVLNPQPLDLESSTLPLNHRVPHKKDRFSASPLGLKKEFLNVIVLKIENYNKKFLFGATNQSYQVVVLTENGFYDHFAQSCLVLFCCPILGC